MDCVMTMGSFCEMNENELLMVDGGGIWGAIAVGVIAVGGIALTIAAAPGAVAGLAAVGVATTAAKVVVGIAIGLEVAGGAVGTAEAYKS